MTGLRALMRLARREIRRHPARSVLVFSLIAVMVATSTAAATVVRTAATSDDDRREADFGEAVARVRVLDNTFFSLGPQSADEVETEIDREDLRAAVESVTGSSAEVVRFLGSLRVGGGADGPFVSSGDLVDVADVDLSPGALAGFAQLTTGRNAVGPAEIVLSEAQLETRGLRFGDAILVEGQEFTVVGALTELAERESRLAVVTVGGFDRLGDLDLPGPSGSSRGVAEVYLDSLGGGRVGDNALFEIVPDLQSVVSESTGSSQISIIGRSWTLNGRPAIAPDQRPEQLSTLLAAVLAIQVALVAAAAFAVGVRRRTRDFGQLLVTGADHRQIRILVLIEAALLGLAGAIVGAVSGAAVAGLMHRQGWLEALSERSDVDLRWSVIDWLGPLVIGVVAAVAAAWWPTRRLRTISPNSALSDHLPAASATIRSAIAGGSAILGGTAALVVLARSEFVRLGDGTAGPLLMLAAILIVFCGALALIGNLIGWFGRWAPRLSLRPRLIVRNSARHQARSWMAASAFVAAMVVPIVFGASIKAYPDSYSNASEASDRWVSLNLRSPGSNYVHVGVGDGSFAPVGPAVAEGPSPVSAADLNAFRMSMGDEIAGIDGLRSAVIWETIDASVGVIQEGAVAGWRVQTIDSLAIADPAIANALGVDPGLITGLGKDAALVVVPDGTRFVPDATELTVTTNSSGESIGRLAVELEMVRVEGSGMVRPGAPWILVHPSVVDRLDVPIRPGGAAWELGARPSEAVQADISARANRSWVGTFGPWDRSTGTSSIFGQDVYRPALVMEVRSLGSGPSEEEVRWVSIALTAGLAALISFITAALAAVELDNEIGSMIASGASPTIRRWLLGAQTTYHLGLAAVIGLPLGVLLFWGATRADVNGPRGPVFPWTSMAVMGLVVPVVVGIAVALVFRNGRPAVSRRLS